MRIFVAGATGAIGRALVPLVANAGHDVAGMTRSTRWSQWLESQGARPVVLDIFDRDAIFTALRREQPGAVIHELTSLGRGDYAENKRIRMEGTRNLVDAALAAGVRRMVAESFCLCAPGEGLAREDDPLDTQSGAYGGTVEGILALEKSVAEVPEGVILRYGMLYGDGTWFARDGAMADQIRRGEFVATADIYSFLSVGDAAQAALQALTWPKGTVNIVDDEPAPGTEWAPVFAAAIGAPAPPVRSGGRSSQRGVSNAKARRDLGWQPIYASWREGFHDALSRGTRARPGGGA